MHHNLIYKIIQIIYLLLIILIYQIKWVLEYLINQVNLDLEEKMEMF